MGQLKNIYKMKLNWYFFFLFCFIIISCKSQLNNKIEIVNLSKKCNISSNNEDYFINKWTLQKEDIQIILDNARPLSGEEHHDMFNIYDCQYVVDFIRNDTNFKMNIFPGSYFYLRYKDTSFLMANDSKVCKRYFVTPPQGPNIEETIYNTQYTKIKDSIIQSIVQKIKGKFEYSETFLPSYNSNKEVEIKEIFEIKDLNHIVVTNYYNNKLLTKISVRAEVAGIENNIVKIDAYLEKEIYNSKKITFNSVPLYRMLINVNKLEIGTTIHNTPMHNYSEFDYNEYRKVK